VRENAPGRGTAPAATKSTASAAGSGRQYERIVSLAPSNTEIIYSLGAQDKLVGRSKFCDYPPQVKEKPVLGDFVSPNIERLAQAKPDLVLLVNGQETSAGLLKKHRFNTAILSNLRIEEISRNVRTVGTMTGTAAQAEKLALHFEKKVATLRDILKSSKRPKVLFVAWPQPLMTAGGASFVNDCITTSGGVNAAGEIKGSYPHLSKERLLLSAPDVIIFPHEAESQTFWKHPPWTSLKAIQEKRFFFLPANQVDGLSRPTLRVIDGLYWLTGRIHPESRSAIDNWYHEALPPVTASGVSH
jgi:iron complex transport system substrate-binding protein